MGHAEKLAVELSEEFVDAAKSAIEGGEFASLDDVVHAALTDWQLRRQEAIEILRALVKEGIESGSEPYDGMDSIKREGRRILAERHR